MFFFGAVVAGVDAVFEAVFSLGAVLVGLAGGVAFGGNFFA